MTDYGYAPTPTAAPPAEYTTPVEVAADPQFQAAFAGQGLGDAAFTTGTNYAGIPRDPYYDNLRPVASCSPNNHHFDCRHEVKCYCGRTERLPLDVMPGL